MTYLHHITLSTGHARRSPRSEVSDVVLADLRKWLTEAIASGQPKPLPYDVANFSARCSVEGGALLLTLLAPLGPHARGKPYRGETMPLITMGVAQRSRQGGELWAMMVAQFGAAEGLHKPAEPWLAVALHPPALTYPESLDWMGDMERCVAWAWITLRPDLGTAS